MVRDEGKEANNSGFKRRRHPSGPRERKVSTSDVGLPTVRVSIRAAPQSNPHTL